MNILFYTPFSGRSRDTETLMIRFKNEGYNVYYVSQQYGREIESILEINKIKVFHSPLKGKTGIFAYFKEILFLILFCRKHKINIIFSHLEPAHFPAVFAQYLVKAKLYICRHHVDEMHLSFKNQLLSYRLTYRLGKNFIVVSKRAKDFMTNVEKIRPDKVKILNLAYDFNLYDQVNQNLVKKIREEYNADLLIISACRLVKDKRPDLSILTIEKLIKRGINVKLILLGDGELHNPLQKLINEKNLNKCCFLLGRKKNILDYLAASDILIHPSLIDSSSVIVKEAGLVSKPVLVCRDVGDCEDYIKNSVNGFLVSKDNFVEESTEILVDFLANKSNYNDLGKNLRNDVINLFGIDNVFPLYTQFLNK